jgi:hypothetical protein
MRRRTLACVMTCVTPKSNDCICSSMVVDHQCGRTLGIFHLMGGGQEVVAGIGVIIGRCWGGGGIGGWTIPCFS